MHGPPRAPRRARAPAPGDSCPALRPGRGGPTSQGPRLARPPTSTYLAAVVVVQVRQAGRLGPGPRAHRGRRGVQADVHGGRGGSGGSRGQCLGGRRWEPVRAGVRARGAGRGRRPAERPAPARLRYCSGRGRRRGQGAGASRAGPCSPPGRLRAPRPSSTAEVPRGVCAGADGPFLSHLSPPRERREKPVWHPSPDGGHFLPSSLGRPSPQVARWREREEGDDCNSLGDGCGAALPGGRSSALLGCPLSETRLP